MTRRLQVERAARGWSQAELARRAGMNATTVSLIESGRFEPYPAQLAKLAIALGWPVAEAHGLLHDEIGAARPRLAADGRRPIEERL